MITQEVDIEELLSSIARNKNIHLRAGLDTLEQMIQNRELFLRIRKVFLGHMNDLSREIVKELLGEDLEGTIK
jgi:hypothetical protein